MNKQNLSIVAGGAVIGAVISTYSYAQDKDVGIALFSGIFWFAVIVIFALVWARAIDSKIPMPNSDHTIRKSNPAHFPIDQL